MCKKQLQIGDTLKMYFSMRGIVSSERLEIIGFDEDFVELERGEDCVWIFNRKTGKCINDNTFGGVRRYIDKEV